MKGTLLLHPIARAADLSVCGWFLNKFPASHLLFTSTATAAVSFSWGGGGVNRTLVSNVNGGICIPHAHVIVYFLSLQCM